MAIATRKKASKPVPPVRKVVKKPARGGTKAAAVHPHLETARLIEDRSPQLLEDLHKVLHKHGFEHLTIRGMAFSSSPADAPATSTGLCPVWRCHTDPNGNNVCSWVLEPC